MKIAVISDIHGNAEAFSAVLEHMEKQGVDRVISLGDNIGYGPDSEKVMGMVRAEGIHSVLGNHELVVKDPSSIRWFNPQSRIAVEIAVSSLSMDSISHIRNMETSLVWEGARFVHGFPPDSVKFYVYQASDKKMARTFEGMAEGVCFVGHTHDLGLHSMENGEAVETPLERGVVFLDPERKYIVNAGSVGQPRDGDNRAKYIIWEKEKNRLTVESVSYNFRETVRKIRKSGIPDAYADRLL